MMKRSSVFSVIGLLAMCLAGCVSGGSHADSAKSGDESRLTVGEVQRKVAVGMSGAQVVEALGSPNVVTTDEDRREVWIYDRVASERVYSEDQGGFCLILVGYHQSAGASSTTQRTLTVIIKFDAQGRVRDFAYHSSQF